MKDSNINTIELCKWLMENEIKFELSTKFCGDDVSKVITIKCNDIDLDDTDDKTERNLHIIIPETHGSLTKIFVGKWDE